MSNLSIGWFWLSKGLHIPHNRSSMAQISVRLLTNPGISVSKKVHATSYIDLLEDPLANQRVDLTLVHGEC